jgi:hypothetical protein
MPVMVVPFGLASSAFQDPQWGDYAVLEKPMVYVFEGLLGNDHIKALLPSLEQAVRSRSPVALVAREVDEVILALLVANRIKDTMRGVVLTPDASAGEDPLKPFAALTVSGYGSAGEGELDVQKPGLVPRLLSTLYETIVVGPLPLLSPNAAIGILHLGGEDLAQAKLRARAARELMAAALN